MKTYLLATLVAVLFLVAGCGKCDVNCENGGEAVESGDDCICECPSRYSGTNCELDLCENFTCTNGEVVFQGICKCECEAGYGGATCNVPLNQQWLFTYTMWDDCQSQYDITITAGTGPADVNIVNLANVGSTIQGTVGTDNKVRFTNVSDGQGRTFSGTFGGAFGAPVYSVTVTGGGLNQTCNGTMVKN